MVALLLWLWKRPPSGFGRGQKVLEKAAPESREETLEKATLRLRERPAERLWKRPVGGFGRGLRMHEACLRGAGLQVEKKKPVSALDILGGTYFF